MSFLKMKSMAKLPDYWISTNMKENISYNLTALSSSNSNSWRNSDNTDNLLSSRKCKVAY